MFIDCAKDESLFEDRLYFLSIQTQITQVIRLERRSHAPPLRSHCFFFFLHLLVLQDCDRTKLHECRSVIG